MIFSAIILSSCAMNKSVSPGGNIDSNNGVLLTKLVCGNGFISGEFHKAGTTLPASQLSLSQARSGYIPCNDKYHLIELPEGDYYFGVIITSVFPHIKYPESLALKFSIAKNKINYIGDLKYDGASKLVGVDSNPSGNTIKIRRSIPKDGLVSIDASDNALSYLEKSKYSSLPDIYSFRMVRPHK